MENLKKVWNEVQWRRWPLAHNQQTLPFNQRQQTQKNSISFQFIPFFFSFALFE